MVEKEDGVREMSVSVGNGVAEELYVGFVEGGSAGPEGDTFVSVESDRSEELDGGLSQGGDIDRLGGVEIGGFVRHDEGFAALATSWDGEEGFAVGPLDCVCVSRFSGVVSSFLVSLCISWFDWFDGSFEGAGHSGACDGGRRCGVLVVGDFERGSWTETPVPTFVFLNTRVASSIPSTSSSSSLSLASTVLEREAQ